MTACPVEGDDDVDDFELEPEPHSPGAEDAPGDDAAPELPGDAPSNGDGDEAAE